MSVSGSFGAFPIPNIDTSTPGDVYALVLAYRTEMAKWVGDQAQTMSKVVDNFNSLMTASKYRNSNLTGQTTDELNTIDKIVEMAGDLQVKTLPLVESFATEASSLLTGKPTVPNLQDLVDAVTASILSELDSAQTNSIEAFKTLIKSIIDTALLNTTYDITATELSEIATQKASFISDKKSEADEKTFLIERETVNNLISKGQLNATRGADTLTRMTAKKTRIYLEIEKQADQYEIELKKEAFQRIYDKMRIKIESGTIVPQELIKLPNAAYGIFDGILARLFLSPGEFVNQLPQILVASINSLNDVARLLQDERFKKLAGDQDSDRNIVQLFQTVLGGYSSLIAATSKMATFEAV